MKCYNINPIGKPRINHNSRHGAKAKRFYAYRDLVTMLHIQIPNSGCHVVFGIQMPHSWSKKKKAIMVGTPHQQKPDIDNLLKALLDSARIDGDDKRIYSIAATKIWTYDGIIIVEPDLNQPNLPLYAAPGIP